MISFRVLGMPIAQGNHRIQPGKFPRIYDAAKGLPEWRKTVAMYARAARTTGPGVLLEGPLLAEMTFRMPVPKSAPKRRRLFADRRPDLSKLVRAVEDALTGVLYGDDAQIVELRARKELAYDAPVGCDIVITPLIPAESPSPQEALL